MEEREMNEDLEVVKTEAIETQDETEIENIEEADDNKSTKLRKQLKTCNEEKAAALEELQRAKADFLNARRRIEESKEADRDRMNISWIESLLPLCDSFHMAMSNTEAWEAVDKNWRIGVEGIHMQLQSIMKDNEVESFDPTGEKFDPERHEALKTEDSDKDSETVLTTIQLGYEQKGEIIRPAKVIISN